MEVVGPGAEGLELLARILGGFGFGRDGPLKGENLIAAKDKRRGEAEGYLAGFGVGKGVSDVARGGGVGA